MKLGRRAVKARAGGIVFAVFILVIIGGAVWLGLKVVSHLVSKAKKRANILEEKMRELDGFPPPDNQIAAGTNGVDGANAPAPAPMRALALEDLVLEESEDLRTWSRSEITVPQLSEMLRTRNGCTNQARFYRLRP